MDLAKVAARLRPRTSWEAIDLGVLLAQRFFRPIALTWLVCILPIVVVAAAFSAATTYFWLPLLMVWWLKPLYDRVPLLILSRAFFGEVPGLDSSVGQVFRSWQSGSALADITWRRLSPFRGLTMPVRELEMLRGPAASERLEVLLRRQVKGPALWLLVVGVATEVLFVGAILLLAHMVIPQTAGVDFNQDIPKLFDPEVNTPLMEAFAFGAYFLAMSAVEIFGTAACFGLYINRRVRLEGWDIELVFKKLAARLRRRARSAVETATMVLLVVVLCLSFGSEPAVAQDHQTLETHTRAATTAPSHSEARETTPPSRVTEAQTTMQEILDHPDFGTTSTEERWELREDLFDFDDEDDDDPRAVGETMREIIAALGATLQIAMWILAACAILGAMVYFFRKVRPPEQAEDPDDPLDGPQAEIVSGQEPSTMTLPVDIVDAAVALWERGEHAESLSVLYRGTLSGLADGYQIEIDPSMTARECAEKVRVAGGPADYVAELAGAWTTTVYADRRVGDDDARALFASWKHHFRRTRR